MSRANPLKHEDATNPGGPSSRLRRAWHRLLTWLDVDQSDPVDLLDVDPALHFQNWDRDLPNRYWG